MMRQRPAGSDGMATAAGCEVTSVTSCPRPWASTAMRPPVRPVNTLVMQRTWSINVCVLPAVTSVRMEHLELDSPQDSIQRSVACQFAPHDKEFHSVHFPRFPAGTRTDRGRQLAHGPIATHPTERDVRPIAALFTAITEVGQWLFQSVVNGREFFGPRAHANPQDPRPPWIGKTADAPNARPKGPKPDHRLGGDAMDRGYVAVVHLAEKNE